MIRGSFDDFRTPHLPEVVSRCFATVKDGCHLIIPHLFLAGKAEASGF